MVPRPNLGDNSNLLSAPVHSTEAYFPFPKEEAIALTPGLMARGLTLQNKKDG